MEKKHRNKNALRSIKLITKAYLELINEMPLEKVTVTKITERAELNRSTFYAHFTCPQDVLNSIEEDAIENLVELINEVPLGHFLKDPLPFLTRIAGFINERRYFYKRIICNNQYAVFFENLKEIIISRLMEDKEIIASAKNPVVLQTNLRFFVGGYISLFRDCLSGKLDMTLNDMTKMMARTISAGISTFF